jgi:hypothetical protein
VERYKNRRFENRCKDGIRKVVEAIEKLSHVITSRSVDRDWPFEI